MPRPMPVPPLSRRVVKNGSKILPRVAADSAHSAIPTALAPSPATADEGHLADDRARDPALVCGPAGVYLKQR